MELSGLFLGSYHAGLQLSDDLQHCSLGGELPRAGLGLVSS